MPRRREVRSECVGGAAAVETRKTTPTNAQLDDVENEERQKRDTGPSHRRGDRSWIGRRRRCRRTQCSEPKSDAAVKDQREIHEKELEQREGRHSPDPILGGSEGACSAERRSNDGDVDEHECAEGNDAAQRERAA